jgi:hypothetical protein
MDRSLIALASLAVASLAAAMVMAALGPSLLWAFA